MTAYPAASFSPTLNVKILPEDSFFTKDPDLIGAIGLMDALVSAKRAFERALKINGGDEGANSKNKQIKNAYDIVGNVSPRNFAAALCRFGEDFARYNSSKGFIIELLSTFSADKTGLEAALSLCEPHDLQPILQVLTGDSGFNPRRGMIGTGQIAAEVDKSVSDNHRGSMCDIITQHIERRCDLETNVKRKEDWECLLALTQHAQTFSKNRIDGAVYRQKCLNAPKV